MYFERERLIQDLIDKTNSSIESVTLESFEDMNEDELRSLILIGNGRVRHAYRPETLYYQYVARRGRNVTDPLDPSYSLDDEDVNRVFDGMRRRFPDFEPQEFEEEPVREIQVKRLIDDDEDEIPTFRSSSSERHRLLSTRNTYLDDLERDFNDMINRQHTRQNRPQEYDKGKGPGGFPMRSGSSNGNVGMPAQEPLFKDHLIKLYDPDTIQLPTKDQKHTLAYKYCFSPYKNVDVFSPGNAKPDQIQSQKMPEWMTTDPLKRTQGSLKRDKVSFMEDIQPSINIQPPTPPTQKYAEVQPRYEVKKPKKENIKLWVIIAVILFVFLLKKRR
jgi:hypothetical protein